MKIKLCSNGHEINLDEVKSLGRMGEGDLVVQLYNCPTCRTTVAVKVEAEWKQVSSGNYPSPHVHMQLDPFPRGPYYLVNQFDVDRFKRSPATFTGEIKVLKHHEEFVLPFGYAAFTVGSNFEPILVGCHYDTSG